jgi:hypothetical protein
MEAIQEGDFVIIEKDENEYWIHKGEIFISLHPKEIINFPLETKITQNYELNYLKGGK